jgi:hypothetical protein
VDEIKSYLVTVEFEVLADNVANAVRQFSIDKGRFVTIRGVKEK